jgi:hypothetical protein
MYLFSFNANIYPPLPFVVTQQPTYLFPLHQLATYPLSTSPPLSPCSPITDALSPFPLFTYSAKGSIVGCYFFPPTSSGLVQVSPRKRRARSMSLGMIVTRFACSAHRLVSSNMPTIYASEASWRARTAKL